MIVLRKVLWQHRFYYIRSCGPMDKASDYESGDCRFESCQDQNLLNIPKCVLFKLDIYQFHDIELERIKGIHNA